MENFDQYVSAEIPTNENPHLRHMMHGPCGVEHPNRPCMEKKIHKKTCKYKYPQTFAEFTTCGDDSYPVYRRRDTKETVIVRKTNMDNRWVIPFNLYLLAKFDCHLNVEVCSTIKAVKYLYKYVYKGHDRISFCITRPDSMQSHDEIDAYQDGRWVSPLEAAWRIFGFSLFEIYLAVIPLHLHLPDMQVMHFNFDESLDDVLANERRSRTMLTDFFRVNSVRPEGPKYLYSEFIEHFVWDAKTWRWKDRKQGVSIGRLLYTLPSQGERYYLRLLLINLLGPTSFEDLFTFDGIRCATFQESSLRHGFLEHDNSIEHCMDEGIHVQMPHALCRLFATLLIFCQPSDPKELWEKYYTSLSEDYKLKNPNATDMVLQATVRDVE